MKWKWRTLFFKVWFKKKSIFKEFLTNENSPHAHLRKIASCTYSRSKKVESAALHSTLPNSFESFCCTIPNFNLCGILSWFQIWKPNDYEFHFKDWKCPYQNHLIVWNIGILLTLKFCKKCQGLKPIWYNLWIMCHEMKMNIVKYAKFNGMHQKTCTINTARPSTWELPT